MLANAVSSAGLERLVDEVISVEEVGIFKPSPQVYELAMRRLMFKTPSDVCFVSANPWDAQAAAQFGFQAVGVDRFGLKNERIPGRPKRIIKSLAELPNIL